MEKPSAFVHSDRRRQQLAEFSTRPRLVLPALPDSARLITQPIGGLSNPMASSSNASLLFSAAAALPGGSGARRSPPSARAATRHQQQPRRLVAAAAAKRRYKGTAMKVAKLTELVERKVAEAMEACAGGHEADPGCRVAWDEVEEVSQARAHLRRRIAEAPHDPLEPFCKHNPTADECVVVYVDD